MNNTQTILIAVCALLLGTWLGYATPFMGVRGGNMCAKNGGGTMSGMSGMHGAMNGMMQGLEGKKGDALDQAFLDEMIVHHEGALDMAQALLAGTERPELIELGNAIIATQTREIQQMKLWRDEWFGN